MELSEKDNVVKIFNIGNTCIKICDNYCCGTTKEETNEILRRISRRVQEELSFSADAESSNNTSF